MDVHCLGDGHLPSSRVIPDRVKGQGEMGAANVGSPEPVHMVSDVVMNAGPAGREVKSVPIASLQPGDSPRLGGEDKEHVARLAESDAPLPPLLVDRRSMKVIDGMHRLMAALLQGKDTIEVEFFDGSADEAFLRAVQANVTHGLPLSRADRRTAAERIAVSHPHLSDRAIAQVAGLGAKTVAAIRRRSTESLPQLNARMGRDGKIRPLSSVEGRLRAAKLLTEHPKASLREVARSAGVSPGTARDVRLRLERGESPAPAAAAGRTDGDAPDGRAASGTRTIRRTGQATRPDQFSGPAVAAVLEKLLRNPSLRHNEQGRRLLRWLNDNAACAQEWPEVLSSVPPHCAHLIAQLARKYSEMWLDFAKKLDEPGR
jgi:ParB-like chromosome segregation protein Spo0J